MYWHWHGQWHTISYLYNVNNDCHSFIDVHNQCIIIDYAHEQTDSMDVLIGTHR